MARGVDSAPAPDRLALERAAWAEGVARVGGIDEAGRGPLAGPVTAACVVLPRPDGHPALFAALAGLTDSKALSPAARERLFARLTSDPAVAWAAGWADVGEIDRINILRATHAAMARAVHALPVMPDLVLVDGLPVPGLPCPSRAVVGGDRLALSVAAASVIAKILRDRRMREADAAYPDYGFGRHKGYGTAAHLAALRRHGPCPLHRRSFAPVAALPGARAESA